MGMIKREDESGLAARSPMACYYFVLPLHHVGVGRVWITIRENRADGDKGRSSLSDPLQSSTV